MFNLKYNEGIFIVLYENGKHTFGVELYPAGTTIIWNGIKEMVVSTLPPPKLNIIPSSPNDLAQYFIHLSDR